MTDQNLALLHPDDADLVRRLDDELDITERPAMDAHVMACAECSARVATLERRSRRLSVLLRSADAPAPATPLRVRVQPAVRVPRWQVAAVIALVAASAVAVPPVRAWIVAKARTAWAAVAGTGGAEPAAPAPDAGAVGFVPVGNALTVRVPARAGGTLQIEVVKDDRVVVMGRAGRPLPGIVVLPSEVRLAASDSIATFDVRVPLRLETVRVIVGEQPARVYRPSVEGERWSVPLGG